MNALDHYLDYLDECHEMSIRKDSIDTLLSIKKLVENTPEGDTVKDLDRLDDALNQVLSWCDYFLDQYKEELK